MAIEKSANVHPLRLRRLMMFTMYVLVLDVTAFSVLHPDTILWRFLGPAALATAATLWCVYDAQARGRPIVTSFHALIFFTWCFSVPVYLFMSRKFRGLLVTLGHATCMFVLFGMSFVLTLSFLDFQGRAALEDGDYDRAAQMYRRFVSVVDNDADSWYRLGMAYDGHGQMNEAVMAYSRALRIAPHLTDCQAAIFACNAYKVHQQGDFHSAILLYERSLDVNDSDPQVWYNLGMAYGRIGDRAYALAAYEKASVLEPGNSIYHNAVVTLKERASTP